MPSRLFIYFNERAIEGILAHNGPVSLRSGYKTVARDGVCSERLWPYDVRKFRRVPSTRCRSAAMEHKAIRYMRIQRNLAKQRVKDSLRAFDKLTEKDTLYVRGAVWHKDTYGAGGTTRDRTLNTVKRIHNETSLKPVAHLTCVDASKDEVNSVIKENWDAGVRHILALRPEHLIDPRYKDWNAVLLAAVDQVLEDAATKGKLADYTWGAYNTTRIQHPLSLAVPALALVAGKAEPAA
jgi:hypothetical protein